MVQNPYRHIERGSPGRIGWRIHYFEEVGSTQETARELATAGAAEGTVVIAEQQTAGRGRMGRRWHSPPGANLYLTVILRPRIEMTRVARLSLVAGLAAAETLETVAPGMVALKWPNDLWLKGRKAGGIIAEALTDSAGSLGAVLLGIGLNINLAPSEIPEELRGRATSLRAVLGRRQDRVEIAEELFSRLERRYRDILSDGFGPLLIAWQKYSALDGRRVEVVESARKTAGIVVGVDADGALLLDTGTNVERIVAGDVTVVGAYD